LLNSRSFFVLNSRATIKLLFSTLLHYLNLAVVDLSESARMQQSFNSLVGQIELLQKLWTLLHLQLFNDQVFPVRV